jgi:hypothetical protein
MGLHWTRCIQTHNFEGEYLAIVDREGALTVFERDVVCGVTLKKVKLLGCAIVAHLAPPARDVVIILQLFTTVSITRIQRLATIIYIFR